MWLPITRYCYCQYLMQGSMAWLFLWLLTVPKCQILYCVHDSMVPQSEYYHPKNKKGPVSVLWLFDWAMISDRNVYALTSTTVSHFNMPVSQDLMHSFNSWNLVDRCTTRKIAVLKSNTTNIVLSYECDQMILNVLSMLTSIMMMVSNCSHPKSLNILINWTKWAKFCRRIF